MAVATLPRCMFVIFCACLLASCGSTGGGNDGGSDGDGAVSDGTGFVFSSMGFAYREDGASVDTADGFDLDNTVSSADSPGVDECAHDDFTSPDGTEGIDHGLLRVIDQFEGLQKMQIVDGVMEGSIKSGAMTIIMELTGLDDTQNDDEVSVQLFSSLDLPPTGATGEVLPGGTLAVHPSSDFHSDVVTGELVDGVLVAGPTRVQWKFNIMIVDDVLVLHDAWVRVELHEDGTASGLVGGYWTLEDMDRIIVTPTTDNGNAAGFMYDEAIEALEANADGQYNAGTCEAISTVFRFDAQSAFIVK